MKNNNKWSQLSMQQRADLIKLYTSNGITNIKDIRNHYNSFGDGGETNKYEKEAKSFLTNWYRNPTTQQMMGELDKTDYERFPVTAPSGATVTDPSLARRVKVNTALNTPSNYVEMTDDNLGRYVYNPTDTSKNEVQVNKDFMNDINSKFIFTHEYEHGIQHEMPFVLGTTQPVEHNLKPGVVEDPYLDSRKETRSRIMEAREFLNLDPSKRDYTPEEAAEFQTRLREGEGYIGTASDLDRLTPETLAGYLNYMADAQIDTNFSTYDNETVSYAKNGGKLNKFATGGPTTWEDVDEFVEKAEPWVSGISLAATGTALAISAASGGTAAPVALPVAATIGNISNGAGVLLDGYQAVRDFQNGNYRGGVWNSVEAITGAFGAKAASKLARTAGGRAIGKFKEQLVEDRFRASGDKIARLMRKGLTYEKAAERVLQNTVNYVDNSSKVKDVSNGIRKAYNKRFDTGATILDTTFDTIDVGKGISSRFKEEHPIEIYKIGGKLNKYVTGGPTEEKNIKTWLNKRVLDRVPGDSEMLGTTGPVNAVLKSIFNSNGYVDKRIKRAENSYTKYKDWIEENKIPQEFSSEKEWLNSLSSKEIEDIYLALNAEKIKQHEDAKRIYLGYEPKYGTMEDSPYKPTIAKNSNTKYYQVNSLLQDREFEDFILPVWTEWKNPEYGTPIRQNVFGDEYKSSRITDKGNVAGVADAPYLNGLTISEGFDNKGQYISLYDTWDYNTKVQGKTGDNVGKYINGKPFEIYQRYYLDEWLDIPEEARGNPWIVPAVLSVKQNDPYEEQESFKLGGKFLTKRRK